MTIAPSWLAYYCRGPINLYYSRRIFNRTGLGIADLHQALAIQRAGSRRRYHVRTFISLGDGYWKTDDFERARAAWRDVRVDTSLRPLWEDP